MGSSIMGDSIMYKNPRYDLNGNVVVQMEYNGEYIDVPLYDGCFIPNEITLAELQAAFDANQPEEIAAYEGPSSSELLAGFMRDNRNRLIKETDLWGLADYPATAEQTAYRQALRDITAQAGFPNEVVWPTKPE
jgi:hypothetical protein